MDATVEAVNILVSESCRGTECTSCKRELVGINKSKRLDSKRDLAVSETAPKSVLTSDFTSVHLMLYLEL